MDVSRHHPLIEELLPKSHLTDFPAIFANATQHESTNSRFLLKMEINRLTTPTRRIIDLRGKVDGECRPYEYDGIIHQLDSVAIASFEHQLAIFHGRYTLGVYEALMHTENSYRRIEEQRRQALRQQESGDTGQSISIPQQIPAASDTPPPHIKQLRFGHYRVRRNERMYFSTPVQLLLDNHIIEATSSDISVDGLRIKVPPRLQLTPGDELQIRFSGFEQEFASPVLKMGIHYRLLGVVRQQGQQWLRLRRTTANSEFDNFIDAFIKDNRRRYKINVNHVQDRVLLKGYEQYYMDHISALPLFFGGASGVQLRQLLLTEHNREVMDYWRDDNRHSFLANFFTPQLMRQLIAQPGKIKETLIYSFSLVRDTQLRFYAATPAQLSARGVSGLYLSYAARKTSWRVYKLQLTAASDSEAAQYSPVSTNSKYHVSVAARQKLHSLRWVGSLQEITHQANLDIYRQWPQENTDIRRLKSFHINSSADDIDKVPYQFVQQRKEQRFSHQTEVIVSTPHMTCSGATIDFSTRGAKIATDQALENIEAGHQLHLKLPALQKLAKSIVLAQLPYNVVGHNPTRTVLHLQAPPNQAAHAGQQFFKMLIDKNSDRLRAAPVLNHPQGMDIALRNVFVAHLFTHPVFIHKRDHQITLEAVGSNGLATPLELLLSRNAAANQYQLEPLFKRPGRETLIDTPLKTLATKNRPQIRRLYIHLNTDDATSSHWQVDCRLCNDFKSDSERRQFVENALQQGELFVIQMQLSHCGRPDLDYVAEDLRYISQYAGHKAKALEERLWQVKGMAELIDVTLETRFQYRL